MSVAPRKRNATSAVGSMPASLRRRDSMVLTLIEKPAKSASTTQKAADAGGTSDQRDREEDDRAERERDHPDEERAHLLKDAGEVDVPDGGHRGEDQRCEEAERFPVRRPCRRRGVHHDATGIRVTPGGGWNQRMRDLSWRMRASADSMRAGSRRPRASAVRMAARASVEAERPSGKWSAAISTTSTPAASVKMVASSRP